MLEVWHAADGVYKLFLMRTAPQRDPRPYAIMPDIQAIRERWKHDIRVRHLAYGHQIAWRWLTDAKDAEDEATGNTRVQTTRSPRIWTPGFLWCRLPPDHALP